MYGKISVPCVEPGVETGLYKYDTFIITCWFTVHISGFGLEEEEEGEGVEEEEEEGEEGEEEEGGRGGKGRG